MERESDDAMPGQGCQATDSMDLSPNFEYYTLEHSFRAEPRILVADFNTSSDE